MVYSFKMIYTLCIEPAQLIYPLIGPLEILSEDWGYEIYV